MCAFLKKKKYQHVIFRSESYGHVYRLNFLHYVTVCVTCPEATKVNICVRVCCKRNGVRVQEQRRRVSASVKPEVGKSVFILYVIGSCFRKS